MYSRNFIPIKPILHWQMLLGGLFILLTVSCNNAPVAPPTVSNPMDFSKNPTLGWKITFDSDSDLLLNELSLFHIEQNLMNSISEEKRKTDKSFSVRLSRVHNPMESPLSYQIIAEFSGTDGKIMMDALSPLPVLPSFGVPIPYIHISKDGTLPPLKDIRAYLYKDTIVIKQIYALSPCGSTPCPQ